MDESRLCHLRCNFFSWTGIVTLLSIIVGDIYNIYLIGPEVVVPNGRSVHARRISVVAPFFDSVIELCSIVHIKMSCIVR